ncbi:MAG: GTPase HflX [Leptospiraceae bacterium]|nr:GTPase HflX [Leptospiraceae bacterium]
MSAQVLKRLRKLAERRGEPQYILGGYQARELALLSSEIGRVIGLLMDRQGRVRQLLVGDAHRIIIPALKTGQPGRLRGVRLIRTDLARAGIRSEDVYDLTLLRLDYLTLQQIDAHGNPQKYLSAHILPGQSPGYQILPAVPAGQLEPDFPQQMRYLEDLFQQASDQTRMAQIANRGLLVGVYTPENRKRRSPEESMAELRELCRTAGVQALEHCVIQKRNQLDPRSVIGSGKALEIAIEAVQLNADMIIFDLELSAAQAKRLSEICDLKIIDRTQLILDIFARNASSREGKLQVELAQMNYLRGRLSEKDDNMSRLSGGIGGRGPGETSLEIGRRRVQDRIRLLEKELQRISQRRQLNRSRRSSTGIPIVAIVGYTNAGKSTLLNALTKSETIAADRLFATLDPATRRLRFPKQGEIILSDTVGFIHDLPPELKRAFTATLEELQEASLILHCIDASAPDRHQKVDAVNEILISLQLQTIPRLLVFNKSDRITAAHQDLIEGQYQGQPLVFVSATTGQNLAHLNQAIMTHESLLTHAYAHSPG